MILWDFLIFISSQLFSRLAKHYTHHILSQVLQKMEEALYYQNKHCRIFHRNFYSGAVTGKHIRYVIKNSSNIILTLLLVKLNSLKHVLQLEAKLSFTHAPSGLFLLISSLSSDICKFESLNFKPNSSSVRSCSKQ